MLRLDHWAQKAKSKGLGRIRVSHLHKERNESYVRD